MKTRRLLLFLGLVSTLTGCGGQRPSAPSPSAAAPPPKAPTVTQEQIAAASKADLDPKALPSPRTPLAATPDLYGSLYAISAATLGAMARNGVPDDIVNNLRKLDGKTFGAAADFVTAAKEAAGARPFQANQDPILRAALVVTLADPPAGPKGQASLDEAAARGQVAALTPTRITLKATDYKIVYFDFDRATIRPEFAAVIKENAARLMQSKAKLIVEGHCDERGTNEYNLALGQRRAEAVRQALVAEGVSSSQLQTLSFGEERPIALGHDEAAWAQNRRAVLTSQQ